MDCHVNNSLMISGSMDGTAKLWNSTSGKCVGTLLCGAKVKERHNLSMVNLNGPHPFVQGCIFSRKIIPLNRNVLKKIVLFAQEWGVIMKHIHICLLYICIFWMHLRHYPFIWQLFFYEIHQCTHIYLFIYLKRIAWVVPGPR